MPNIKSAKKRVLVARVRNARNKAERSAMKTAVKKFEAAAKGILHRNNAAHKKSAMTLKLNQMN